MNPSKNTLEKIVKKSLLLFFSLTLLLFGNLCNGQEAGKGDRIGRRVNAFHISFTIIRDLLSRYQRVLVLSYSWICFWVSPNILAFSGYCVRMLGGDQTHLQISKAVLMIYNEPIMETLMREVFPSIWSCHLLVLTSDLIWAVFAACLSLLLWITGKQNLKISRIWHPRCCADITCMTIFDKGKHE